MTTINQLIADVSPHIPFANEAGAQSFLNQYNVDDQEALITALYVGRDHIHGSTIQDNYVSQGMTLDRHFMTKNGTSWAIQPAHFARILYEKNSNLNTYYAAFTRSMQGSGYSLNAF